MINLNILLQEVIKDAESVNFPVCKSLSLKIIIDTKRYDRVGACYRYKCPERYEIHLSEAVKKANTSVIKSIIAHEVLHAHFLTMEHNCFWRMYQQRMNEQYGYDIQVKYSWQQILR